MKRNSLLIFIITTIFVAASVQAASTITFYFNTSLSNNVVNSSTLPVPASAVMLNIITDKPGLCKYSKTEGTSYDAMENNFDYNLDTLHKKGLTNLNEGINTFFIRCKDSSGNISTQLTISFSAFPPISAKITLSKTSPVNAGELEITLKTSKFAAKTPELSFSYDGASYNPLPIYGAEDSWKGHTIISETLGNAVCSFKFKGIDIEGIVGDEITSGGEFIIDTIVPKTLTNLVAIGYLGRIDLSWYTDEDLANFKIYKSTNPNVKYTDYYKTISGSSNIFSDTLVEKGKTYYYRITGIDSAGNEGDLSVEVSATALFDSNSQVPAGGLSLTLYGLVDNTLAEIGAVQDSAEQVQPTWQKKTEVERQLFSDLKLEREINSAKQELTSLKGEVEKYKQQDLSKTELEKKLNTATMKLNIIKKKIPESLTIISEKGSEQKPTQNDIEQLLLKAFQEKTKDDLDQIIKKSTELIAENVYSVKTNIYNLELLYLDGSRKEKAVLKELITSKNNNKENKSFFEMFPNELTENSVDIESITPDAKTISEKALFEFGVETQQITFIFTKAIDLDITQKAITILVDQGISSNTASRITGYFSLLNNGKAANTVGIIIGLIIIASLFLYFRRLKHRSKPSLKYQRLQELIKEIQERIAQNDQENAKIVYKEIAQIYEKLPKHEQEKTYVQIQAAYNKIK